MAVITHVELLAFAIEQHICDDMLANTQPE
jgi:hypothetical protein